MPRPNRYVHALVLTGMVFAFIGLLRLVTFNTHYLAPFRDGMQDYEVTDIMFSQLRDSSRIDVDKRIVLVHVEDMNRREIAELTDKIAAGKPLAIGLDILFASHRDAESDSTLAATLRRHGERIVLASNLEAYDEEREGVPGIVTSATAFSTVAENAYSNFLAGTDRTVRLVNPFVTTLDGTRHDAFAIALARRTVPHRVQNLTIHHSTKPLRINYRGDYRSFLRIDGSQLLQNDDPEALAVFRDRIVLVGFVNSDRRNAPIEDRYFTPLNPVYTGKSLPDMYGTVIHANILSMVLDGKYIFEIPWWMEVFLITAFTYLNLLIIHWIYHNLPDSYHGITRLMQLVELFVLFFLVSLLFYHYRLKIEFAVGFLALVLAYDMVMIYESFIRKRIPYLKKPTHD